MNSCGRKSVFKELQSEAEKSKVFELLTIKKDEEWKSQNFDRYWHTTRMLQSLTHLILDKKIFVDNIHDVKIILGSFQRDKKKIVENFELWINSDVTDHELDILGGKLFGIIKSNIQQNKLTFFRSVPNILAKILETKLSENGINLAFKGEIGSYMLLKDMNRTGIQYNDNFEMRKIPIENLHQIFKNWKYGREIDKDWISNSIQNCPSFGIWEKEHNEMIGQFIYMITGTFGALVIDDKYRGLGLAKLLISEQHVAIVESNMHLLIEIEIDNEASQSLFEKLNFVKVSKSFYMVFDKIGGFPKPGDDF